MNRTHSDDSGEHIALISIHGLIRGEDLELGRDSDTGGQALYVLELARALGRRAGIRKVDLLTRRIVDPSVGAIYAQSVENIAPAVDIVRLDCGPEAYIAKEDLWDHLDAFADNAVAFYQGQDSSPDLIHSHYADAGYVGIRLSSHLGVPLFHTGHSLGRTKRSRLLASGLDRSEIERRYHILRRIESEEDTLAIADRVIVSTENEIEQQYALYDHYEPDRMRVIPPGTDLQRFRPPDGTEQESPIYAETRRFLQDHGKPMILSLSRKNEKKNIGTLIDAFGGSPELQEVANLVIVAGTRDDIHEMDDSAARVFVDILLRIDTHDLYGRVAYPKTHRAEDVPILYRLAATHRGVFVNPALIEPFGLTLIEAAASGLPVVATEEGGPRDILDHCENGYLVDPLDTGNLAEVILRVLTNGAAWEEMAEKGLRGVHERYSWDAHGEQYMREVCSVRSGAAPRPVPELQGRPMLFHDRALFTDLDRNLLADRESLRELVDVMRRNRRKATFGIATGRTLESALRVMREFEIPTPDVLITATGSSIHYGPDMTEDMAWRRHIDHLWTPRAVRSALSGLPGLKLQPKIHQGRFKLSYYFDPAAGTSPEDIARVLRQNDQTVNTIFSFGQYLDILPVRASKGFAVRWFAEHWDVALNQILTAGGSGADEDMIRGNTLAAVVGHRRDEELSELVDLDRVYFARARDASGILEAIEHYDFFGSCRERIESR